METFICNMTGVEIRRMIQVNIADDEHAQCLPHA